MATALVDRFFFWLSNSRVVEGILVASMDSHSYKEALQRVGDALRLIKTSDAIRFRMVLKDVGRIWVRLLPGHFAEFEPGSRACLIDQRFLLAYPVEFIASAIIHEATHGRLLRRNIPYSEALRFRVERACLRRELAFARRIPNGEVVIAQTKAKLQHPPEFFTDEAMQERSHVGEIESARVAGIPDWVLRVALRVRHFRIKLMLRSGR